jgi:hypothetical protein
MIVYSVVFTAQPSASPTMTPTTTPMVIEQEGLLFLVNFPISFHEMVV